MNKREITKVFNEAELEAFTLLPIERMELLKEAVGDGPKDNAKLAEAIDTYLSLALVSLHSRRSLLARRMSVGTLRIRSSRFSIESKYFAMEEVSTCYWLTLLMELSIKPYQSDL
jgi:hypothetical protein